MRFCLSAANAVQRWRCIACLRWITANADDMKRSAIGLATLATFALSSASNAQPGGGLALGIGWHGTRGETFRNAQGPVVDATYSVPVLKSSRWSAVLGGGGTLVSGHSRCLVLPNGDCARNGGTAGLNALVGTAVNAGQIELRLGVGPAFYRSERVFSRGTQLRLDILDQSASKVAFGIWSRITVVPRSQSVERDMLAIGAQLRIR